MLGVEVLVMYVEVFVWYEWLFVSNEKGGLFYL